MTATLWLITGIKSVATFWSVPTTEALIPNLTFDLTIGPHTVQRMAQLNQKARGEKTTLTLQTVSVTASETRFAFLAEPSSDIASYWDPQNLHLTKLDLQIGDWHATSRESIAYPREGLGTSLGIYRWSEE